MAGQSCSWAAFSFRTALSRATWARLITASDFATIWLRPKSVSALPAKATDDPTTSATTAASPAFHIPRLHCLFVTYFGDAQRNVDFVPKTIGPSRMFDTG